MPQKPTTLDTVQLAIELLKRIPRTGKASAPELLRQVTEAGWTRDLRTIQRQLEELSSLFDIERDTRSKPYGYKWKENAAGLKLPGLTAQESLLLTLAKQQLADLLPAHLKKSMSGFFEQARAKIDHHAGADLERQWLRKVRVISTTQPLLPPRIKPEVLEVVSDALYRNHWLDVVYTNGNGDNRPAKVMPLGLAQQGPRMYLICRFDGYDNERTLALHRFNSAKSTGLGFQRPPEFDLARYDADGRFGFGEGKRIELKFHIDEKPGRHLLETPLSTDQTHTTTATGFEISATVVDTQQLRWWLRGFGKAVTLISPANLLD